MHTLFYLKGEGEGENGMRPQLIIDIHLALLLYLSPAAQLALFPPGPSSAQVCSYETVPIQICQK